MTSQWLLPALIAVPTATAILLAGWRRLGEVAAARLATATAVLTLGLAGWAALAAGPFDRSGMELVVDRPWIPALGVRFHLGLDGISAPLVLLTALLGVVVCAHLLRHRPAGGSRNGLLSCLLLVEAGALATFTSLDAVLFFVAFELVLIPMWLVIDRWGDDKQPARSAPPGWTRPGGVAARRDAANRFILFTALGSAVMLAGLLLVALKTGTTDLVVLASRAGAGLDRNTQIVAAALIIGGLAVKAPMFGVHTWLPPAHTIAPTEGSVLLAGVLLKMGTYGLVRVPVPVLPEGTRAIAPLLAAFGVAGILWGGLACFVERDLKRLIALSSVAHMGFVLLGIASMTPAGLQGALFANVAHGLITGLLFLVVGGLKDRHHSADLQQLGSGLRDRWPRLGWLLAFGAIAGLGLPGLAGFWGELLAIVGTWQADGALGALARPLAVLATVGTAVAAAYLLRVLRLVWHGRDATEASPRPDGADAAALEVTVSAPLVLITLALGLLPQTLLSVTGPATRALLGMVGAR